jgi:beta-fructofuranosidase
LGNPKSIFDDSIVSWHMDNLNDLKAIGNVIVGVELQDMEREASLRRGGDGRIARFNGGYLIAGQDKEIDLDGKKEMTLCIRLCDIEGNWNSPIFARYDLEDNLSKILYCAQVNRNFISYETAKRIQDGKSLEFTWRTEPLQNRVKPEFLESDWYKHLCNIGGQDFVDGIMRIGVPVDIISLRQWHDIVIRFKNAILELFVDGVLVDEEWPHGALHRFCSPFLIGAAFEDGKINSGFYGMIDHVALWDRALDDEEIASISGGKEEINRRETEILGEEKTELQYWCPRGYNTFVGDCMPFYHDGEFHLYYLFDRRHHTSKWGMGAHQFAHSSSKDLVHWKHHPLSLPIIEQWECSLGTGCIVHHEGKYHEYYIHHGKRGYFSDAPYMRETILSAIGDDGIHFTKDAEPVIPIDYREFGDVNPDVFPDASGKRYYMSISGWKVFTSTDLDKWEETNELSSPQDIPRWICCSYFEWNGWYYFAGCGMYRMSREPLGPGWNWIEPSNPATQEGLGVPKIAAFTGNRYLMVGFLGKGYGGEAVFRELVQHEDGTLGTKFPSEMIPKCGDPLNLPFSASTKGLSIKYGSINIDAPDSFIFGFYESVPKNVRITLKVKPKTDVQYFGLCFRGEGNYDNGFELRFEPARQRVQYGSPESGGMAPESNRCINGVAGLDNDFTLDIIVKNDFVDTCIDNRRTIITRFSDTLKGDRLFLFVSNGEVTFEDITQAKITVIP